MWHARINIGLPSSFCCRPLCLFCLFLFVRVSVCLFVCCFVPISCSTFPRGVRQELRSLTVSWPLSFETEQEKKEMRDSKPFTYIGSLLVRDKAVPGNTGGGAWGRPCDFPPLLSTNCVLYGLHTCMLFQGCLIFCFFFKGSREESGAGGGVPLDIQRGGAVYGACLLRPGLV